jgi:hypothetical protein
MGAIGAEKLDLLMSKLVPVAIKLALALRAGHPKNFRHDASHWERKFEIRISKLETNLKSIKSQTRKIQNPEYDGSSF